jgi:hypothetical protein
VPTDSTVRTVPTMMLRYSFDNTAFDANDDITITFPEGHDALVYDIIVGYGVAEGGALTGTFRDTANGGGAAVSSALDLNGTPGVLQRTTSVGGSPVSSGGSLYFNASANPGTLAQAGISILYTHTT